MILPSIFSEKRHHSSDKYSNELFEWNLNDNY